MISAFDIKIDEDVIVTDKQSSRFNQIGQIWKVKSRATQRSCLTI